MFLVHRMIYRNIILILNHLYVYHMVCIVSFRFNYWQRDTATADNCFTGRLDYIPADGTHIELTFHHVGRTVAVLDVLTGQ